MPSADRPLTDAQERALIALDDSFDYAAEFGDGYTCPMGVSAATLDVLARKGLVATRERPMATVARITEAGRELLRGMGD